MLLSDNVLHYLDSSSRILDCGIIITDLSKILYANTSSLYSIFKPLQESNYLSKQISKDLSNIVLKWSNIDFISNDIYEIYNNYYTEKNSHSTLKLIEDDKVLYLAQSIFPIFNNGKLEGLFICFRNHNHYIDSSIKPILTKRNFIQKSLNNNYMLGVS